MEYTTDKPILKQKCYYNGRFRAAFPKRPNVIEGVLIFAKNVIRNYFSNEYNIRRSILLCSAVVFSRGLSAFVRTFGATII